MDFSQDKIILPEFTNSSLGIPAAYLNFFGADSVTPPLPELELDLNQKNPRNVIFLLMDAMGSGILERHLPPSSFLRSNLQKDLTAIYPCTTVCVTSSLFSGLPPISHAWLAWALYFKEWNQVIEVHPYRDAFGGQLIDPAEKNILTFMDFETIFEKIERATDHQVKVDCLFTDVARPRLVQLAGDRLTSVSSLEGMLLEIEAICRQPGQHFVVGYWKSPDDLLHHFGLSSEKVGEFLTSADRLFRKYIPRFEEAATLITADHGMQDITTHFRLDQIEPLNELVLPYPSGDSRSKMIAVTPGKEDLFAERFNKEFGSEFLLLPAEEVLARGYFGEGPIHPKVRDFLGTFMAIGTSHSDLLYAPAGGKAPKEFKGHHAGISADEMRVPLILC